MAHDDSRPAFPQALPLQGEFHIRKRSEGMSLRDYFAGQELLALGPRDDMDEHDVAAYCYVIADAMLLEREK